MSTNKDKLSTALAIIWVGSWFLAIWHYPYNVQWFLTGVLAAFLGVMLFGQSEKNKE